MSNQKTPAAPGRIATVVATAAVTLAVGVTVAAVGGYLTPKTVSAPHEPEPVVFPAPEAAVSVGAPEVVLVPIAPTQQRPAVAEPPAPEARAVFAAYEQTSRDDDDDDDDDDDGHEGRHHEDEDDDD